MRVRLNDLPRGTWETEDYLDTNPNTGDRMSLGRVAMPDNLIPVRVKMTIDNDGRIYVSTGDAGIQVFAADGKYAGVIPLPRSASSVAFSGPNKKVLYGKGAGMKNPDGTEYRVQGRNNAKAIYKIDTIAQGFTKRAK